MENFNYNCTIGCIQIGKQHRVIVDVYIAQEINNANDCTNAKYNVVDLLISFFCSTLKTNENNS